MTNTRKGHYMNQEAFIVVHRDAVPDVLKQVLEAKALLKSGEVESVAEAAKKVGISRTTYYKYADYVYTLTDGLTGKKATISMILDHQSGVLSKVLQIIAENKGNVITISQSAPIDAKATVTITMDISNMGNTFSHFSKELECLPYVHRFTLEAIETNT